MSELRCSAAPAPGEVAVDPTAAAQEVVFEPGGAEIRLVQIADIGRFVASEALLGGEVAAEPPYWMHLWPGARVLARALFAAPWLRPGMRLLELGCGLGLPALAAARRGLRVAASDWKREPLELLGRSVRLNGCAVDRLQMDWSQPALRRSFDVCCGADVAYDADAEGRLVAAAAEVLVPGGLLLLADSVNTYRKSMPDLLAARGFAVEEREVGETEEGRNVWVRLLQARRT